ncbi:MAG: hypothetical protein P8L85_16290 [Rubripirellula sp.]|nr:hypothetical protein [Rubripirellula sp.]
MQRIGFATAFCLFFFCLQSSVNAQLSDADKQRLVSEIEVAVTQIDEGRFPDFQSSSEAVLLQIDQTKAYFQSSTDPANAGAWMAYFDLEPLADAIHSDQSPVAIGLAARKLRVRLVGFAAGLELRAVGDLRTSVETLITSVVFRDRDRRKELIARQLNSLVEIVRSMDANPTPMQSTRLAAVMRVLESSGQATDLIETLRQIFDEPNVAVVVSEAMVQQAIEREVDESRPVRDCILGTRIVGTALLEGRVTAELLPSADDARINLTLDAKMQGQSIGYNRSVRLRTISNGQVAISREVILDPAGVQFSADIPVDASLSSRIIAIEHPLGLVRKIAKKKAAQQKPLADQIALGKFRNQVRDQFVEETEGVVGSEPSALDRARRVLKRLSLSEPLQRWSTSEDRLSLQALFRRHDQLATVTPRPMVDECYPVMIQVHESALDNAFSPVLAGRTVREDELNQLLEKSGRQADDTATADEERESPFEIDFARLRPIIFEARDDTLRVGVRGTRFLQGGRELKQSMEITAVYAPVERDGVMSLVRQGDVAVDFPGGRRLTVSQAGLRRTIQKKFSSVFPESVLDRTLEIPADAKLETLRGRVFQPQLIVAQDGWFTIAVR